MFLLGFAEKVFVVLSLLFFTDALFPILKEVGGVPINPIIKVCLLVMQAGTIFLLVTWYKRVFRTVIQENLLWILLGIIAASVFWADEPMTTLGSVRNLMPAILLAVYFAARYSLKEQLQLLAWMFGIVILLSIVFALALPSYGVMGMAPNSTVEALSHAGAWRGIFSHKNVLGRIMALSAIIFLCLASGSGKYRWVPWVGCGISVSLLLLSTSKSSLIIFLTIVSVLPLYRALRWNYSFAIPFLVTVILVSSSAAILFFGNAETILAAFGRDPTLTGRTDLWAVVVDKIWQRPWLGYGYEGFWRGLQGESADVWKAVRWQAPHSHNGFLDLWLDIGLIGLITFVLSLITVYFRAVIWVRLTKTAEGLWPIAYLTFLLLSNITESSLLRQKFLWIMYVVISLSIYRNAENITESQTFWQKKKQKKVMPQITQGSL